MSRTLMAKSDAAWGAWEIVTDDGGIKIEARKNGTSGLLETRMSTAVGGPSDELWKELTTPASYMKLMPKTVESKHIDEKPAKKLLLLYQRLRGGLGADRDYTLEVTWTEKKSTHGTEYHRQWKAANDKGPPAEKGVVRVEVIHGSWSLKPLKGGKTEFQQVSYLELGGSVWAIVANAAVKDGALELARNLRKAFPG